MKASWEKLKSRLPRVPLGTPWKPANSPRNREWRYGAATAVLCALAVLAGFWAAFPEQQLLEQGRRMIFAETGVILRPQTADVAFPMTLRMQTCRVESLPVPLVLERVEVSPVWTRLLLGDPSVTVHIRAFAGELDGEFGKNGQVEAEVSGVDLGAVEGLPGNYRLAGTLAGSARGSLSPRGELTWQLRLSALSLSGLQVFGLDDALPLGMLEVRGTLQGRTLQIESVQLAEGVLEASGNGTLVLGQNPATSRIAMNLQLRPTDRMPQALRDLMSLTGQSPDPEGWYRLRLNGRLDAPSIR